MLRAVPDGTPEDIHGLAVYARSPAEGLALTDRGPQTPDQKEREDAAERPLIGGGAAALTHEGWKLNGRNPRQAGFGSRQPGPALA